MKNYDYLMYISKSKKYLFEHCPLAFKFNYIDDIEQPFNPYFAIGIDVHDFIENLFNIIKPQSNGELLNISKLKYHPNTDYKKNVVKFEIERWKAVHKAGFGMEYFIPLINEKKMKTENPKLIGIPDRVHKCFEGDSFAPPIDKFPNFRNGNLVVVDNKTGKPTKSKCKNYEEDLLWYKAIVEIHRPDLGEIKFGAIYFPFDNYVYHVELKKEDVKKLLDDIDKVRNKIKICLDTGMWPANASFENCKWCNYKDNCMNVVLR